MIAKPTKIVVPTEAGLSWSDDGAQLFQEKLDGKFSTTEIGDSILAGEQMADGFVAFDVVQFGGADVRGRALSDRWAMLSTFADQVAIVRTGAGGEFVRAILDEGGEGVVAKAWSATYYDAMLACKRMGTWECTVTGLGSGQSVTVSRGGLPSGSVSLFGGRRDQVRIGSVLKIEGFGLTAAGKIREPRPCRDSESSWLIKF